MSTLLPFSTLEGTYEQVEIQVRQRLASAGFRVVPSFDLHVARLAHPDCSCPHHGTDQCTCQMVILLVYGKQESPATLVIHGQDGKTWLSLATPLETPSRQALEASVRKSLMVLNVDEPASVGNG